LTIKMLGFFAATRTHKLVARRNIPADINSKRTNFKNIKCDKVRRHTVCVRRGTVISSLFVTFEKPQRGKKKKHLFNVP